MSAVLRLQLIDQDMMVNKRWSPGDSFIEIDDTELGQEVTSYEVSRVAWELQGPLRVICFNLIIFSFFILKKRKFNFAIKGINYCIENAE